MVKVVVLNHMRSVCFANFHVFGIGGAGAFLFPPQGFHNFLAMDSTRLLMHTGIHHLHTGRLQLEFCRDIITLQGLHGVRDLDGA